MDPPRPFVDRLSSLRPRWGRARDGATSSSASSRTAACHLESVCEWDGRLARAVRRRDRAGLTEPVSDVVMCLASSLGLRRAVRAALCVRRRRRGHEGGMAHEPAAGWEADPCLPSASRSRCGVDVTMLHGPSEREAESSWGHWRGRGDGGGDECVSAEGGGAAVSGEASSSSWWQWRGGEESWSTGGRASSLRADESVFDVVFERGSDE